MLRIVLAGMCALTVATGGCSGCADDAPPPPPGVNAVRPRSAIVGSRALRATLADASVDAGPP